MCKPIRCGVQERVKSGAIELRKVNGLVNPADLFTKHLSTRERIEQLVTLFNCEYREGRAQSAPELRKTRPSSSSTSAAAAYAAYSEQEQSDVNCRSVAHDPDVLPHMYGEADMNDVFFRAIVPDDGDSASATRCMCSRPECNACFPKVRSEFGTIEEYTEVWLMHEEKYIAASRRRSSC